MKFRLLGAALVLVFTTILSPTAFAETVTYNCNVQEEGFPITVMDSSSSASMTVMSGPATISYIAQKQVTPASEMEPDKLASDCQFLGISPSSVDHVTMYAINDGPSIALLVFFNANNAVLAKMAMGNAIYKCPLN